MTLLRARRDFKAIEKNMPYNDNKNNKIALISGASAGIGRAIARELGSAGYNIGVNYLRDNISAEQIVDEIKQIGGDAIAIQGDISVENDVQRIFAQLNQFLGPLDVLVNNASCRYGAGKNFDDIDSQDIDRVFKTNTYGTFMMCQSAIRVMKRKCSGAIINLSSETAKFGGHKMPHFAASKAAVNALTVALAREVGVFNIRVNAISPGLIDTPIQKMQSEEKIKELVASTPMNRMGRPEEVAKTVKWLISEEASYVSGAVISVTGGR